MALPHLSILPALLAASLVACTWVKPDEAGQRVRVAYDGRVEGCLKVGEIGVAVRDWLLPGVRRNEMKVLDELESLARNQAATIDADTLVALGEARSGEQRFSAWRCQGQGENRR